MLAATLLCYFFSKMKLRRHVLRNILIKHCLTTNNMSCNLYTHFCRASAYWRAILIQQICPSVCLSVRPSVRYVPVQDENGLTCRPMVSEHELKEMFSAIRHAAKSRCLIVGDFNYPNIDWDSWECSKDDDEFVDLIQDNFLFQHVRVATRGNNILDLVFSNEVP